MALWVCGGCGAGYSVDAPRCPQCGADEPFQDQGGESMAKITRHGGFTNAAAGPGERGYIEPPADETEATEAADGTLVEAEELDTRSADEVVAAEPVDGVKTWVGDDRERAEAALVAEQATASPRSTLVTWLEGVLALDEQPAASTGGAPADNPMDAKPTGTETVG